MRQSKLPYVFGALVATIIVAAWFLDRIDAFQIDGVGNVGYTLFVCLFALPFAILMWIRVLMTPFAVRVDEGFLLLWSSDLFSRKVRIPVRSIYDVRITERKVAGEPVRILRLLLTDGEEVAQLRSDFRSSPHFGFYENSFGCCLSIGSRRLSALVDEIQQLIRTRCEQGSEFSNVN